MKNIIHYTSNWNWRRIKQSGALLAKTNHNRTKSELSDYTKSIMGDQLYLVGIPEGFEDKWIDSGLMKYVFIHTKGEIGLKVPIINPDMSFVREHVYLSPLGFENKYNEDLWTKLQRREISRVDPRVIDASDKYLNSTIPLNNYNGNYSVPEVWLAQKTPIEIISKKNSNYFNGVVCKIKSNKFF